MNIRSIIIGALLAALLLQGCSGLLTSEQAAKQYYLLVPLEAPHSTAAADSRQPLELSVAAVPGLDTDRILALGADARLNRYSNARWPDYLPEVLMSVLRRSLETVGGYDTAESMGRSDDRWQVRLEARQFFGLQGTTGETRQVLVELAGSLDCMGRSHPVNLVASSAVTEQRLSAVVAAHQAGLDNVTRELLGQLAEHCGN